MKKCLVGLLVMLLAVSAPAFAANPSLGIWHMSEASIVDWTSNYDKAAFSCVFWSITADPDATGSLIIKDASFTYGTWDNFLKRQGTTISNATQEFPLAYDAGVREAVPMSSKGEPLTSVWGAANSGLSQKEFSITLGDQTVNGVLPEIRSTVKQLATCVLHFELALNSQSTMIEAIKWSFIDLDDPVVQLTKGLEIKQANIQRLANLRFQYKDRDSSLITINKYFEGGDELQGIHNLEQPLPVKNLDYVTATFTDEEQTPHAEVFYQWRFFVKRS